MKSTQSTKTRANYGPSTATCSCTTTFITGSTRPLLQVEMCSVCHPFYTGRTKLVDARGRIERFNRRYKVRTR
jgi:large subunit ribosomal protein L31